MAVPDQALASVCQPRVLHRGQECVSFCFDRLRQQPTGATAQNGRQWVVDRVGLTERDNGATAYHAVASCVEIG